MSDRYVVRSQNEDAVVERPVVVDTKTDEVVTVGRFSDWGRLARFAAELNAIEDAFPMHEERS